MSPAQELQGKVLVGQKTGLNWSVKTKLKADNDQSGGQFSVGYMVEAENGRRAFMKATDISLIFENSENQSLLEKTLKALQSHKFELNVLDHCRGNNMDRIIVAIDHGESVVEFEGTSLPVFYLVFELAESDIRTPILRGEEIDDLWRIAALHHLSVAVQQLHTGGICHNDIKPANFLVLTREIQKLGDLGHATSENHEASHRERHEIGDPTYASPEIQYAQSSTEKLKFCGREARRAADLYQLGSLAYYMFSGHNLTPIIVAHLSTAHRPHSEEGGWEGSFSDVLPYWRAAFNDVMLQLESDLSATRSERVMEILRPILGAIRQLSDPDPSLRGHPAERLGTQDRLAVRQYVSMFDGIRNKLAIAA